MTFAFRIVLNYRRDDSPGHAGRLYDALALRFGAEHVFTGIDNLEPGVDSLQVIEAAIDPCDAFLALIGPSVAGYVRCTGTSQARVPGRFRAARNRGRVGAKRPRDPVGFVNSVMRICREIVNPAPRRDPRTESLPPRPTAAPTFVLIVSAGRRDTPNGLRPRRARHLLGREPRQRAAPEPSPSSATQAALNHHRHYSYTRPNRSPLSPALPSCGRNAGGPRFRISLQIQQDRIYEPYVVGPAS